MTRKVKPKDVYDLASTDISKLSNAYLIAKQSILKRGFEDEIDWQLSTKKTVITESLFLRESAWVVLSSGMSEVVIRSIFPKVSQAFYNWSSAAEIFSSIDNCRERALLAFGSTRKIDAIIKIASHVKDNGFDYVQKSVSDKGVKYISEFPFMGPATSFHLAKNLGLSVAKPDRHLIRIAEAFGYIDVQNFCSDIADYVGDDIAEIDLVLWRYATLDRNYIDSLKKFSYSH